MTPPCPTEEEDEVRWPPSSDGVFTVASTYKWLKAVNETPQRLWRCIWKLKVPERVMVFMWQVNHQHLPTKAITSKWSGASDICSSCQRDEENVLHALRDCLIARTIWETIVPLGRRNNYFDLSWEE